MRFPLGQRQEIGLLIFEEIVEFMYGAVMLICRMSKRRTPWMMAVMVLSGISMVLTMRPSVPVR